MTAVSRTSKGKYQTDSLAIKKWFGRNTFGPHSQLLPGELRTCLNADIYDRFLKSRRGTAALIAKTQLLVNEQVVAAVAWDTGDAEYVVFQTISESAGRVLWCLMDSAGTYEEVVNKGGSTPLTFASADEADLIISDGRLLIFHPTGNKIVEFVSAGPAFEHIPMGLPLPYISAVTAASGSGLLTGRFVWGLELCYIEDGVEKMASTPNRKMVTSGELAMLTLTSQDAEITAHQSVLDADLVWNFIRLYRSKRLDVDLSDPNGTNDLAGVATELYPVRIMSRAAFIAAGYKFSGANRDNVKDSQLPYFTTTIGDNTGALYPVYTIDRIELPPLPAASLGCFHRGRLWAGNPETSRTYWSNYAGTRYAHQYDPQQTKGAEAGDGQQLVKLISFENHLIAIKEAKTLKLTDGNPAFDFDTIDHAIGIAHKRMAAYVPNIGIVAITNDNGLFKILSRAHVWGNQYGGLEVSKQIQEETKAIDPSRAGFMYLNGKLWISDGTGIFHILHAEQGKGWSTYEYPMAGFADFILTFGNGSRGAVLSRGTYIVEVDKVGVNTDADTSDDTDVDFYGDLVPHRFSVDDGRRIIEQEELSVMAELSDQMIGAAYAAGLPWQNGVSETQYPLTPDPNIFANDPVLKRREYRFTVQPPRPIGPDIHYRLLTRAPFTIESIVLRAQVLEGVLPSFDPYQYSAGLAYFPTWGSDVLLHLTFNEEAGGTAFDISGRARHHEWTPGTPAGTHTFDPDLVPNGGQSVVAGTGSGYSDSDWDGMDYIGDDDGFNSEPLTYEFVAGFPSLASVQVIHEALRPASTDYWRIQANPDGSLEFQIQTSGLAYAFTTAAGIVVPGATDYTIQFVLSNGGQNGQFYAAPRGEAFSGALLTTRSEL